MREALAGDTLRWNYGVRQLDNLVGGIRSNSNIVLMAGTGVGKSSFAGTLAYNIAKQFKETDSDLEVRYVTREMPGEDILRRLACSTADFPIPLDHVDLAWKGIKPELAQREQQEYLNQLDILETLPLKFIEGGNTPEEIYEQICAEEDGKKCGFFIIDYLGIMPGCGDDEKGMYKMSKVAGEIYTLTQNLCSGLTLVQINKDVLRRPDKHPLEGDARGAGPITYNATLLLSLYRADRYIKLPRDKVNDPKPAELNILKNRNGPDQGTIDMIYIPGLTKWIEDDKKGK